jgi:uncharacterized tellurite resistance protein B-like protein
MRNLKKWLSERLSGSDSDEAEDGEGFKLAVAALMVEVLRADHETDEAERRQVVESIGRQLGLGESDGRELLELAERRVDASHDLYQFTSQVNRVCNETEKLRLVEQLWRVASADSVIHKYEEHLIRRIADLLHVPHRAFIVAKLRAEESGQ